MLPDYDKNVSEQLLLILGEKEKHHYLSENFKSTTKQLESLRLSKDITIKDFVLSKEASVRGGLKNLLQSNPDLLKDTDVDLVFRNFILCCNECNSLISFIQQQVNESAAITVKFIDSIVCDAEEALSDYLKELKLSIDSYAKLQYVDQEIIINYDTLETLLNRVRLEIEDRHSKNFPSTVSTKMTVQSNLDATIESTPIADRINLSGFQNLVSDIKSYSEKELEKLYDKKEYDILHSLVDNTPDIEMLRLIKQKQAFENQLLFFSNNLQGGANKSEERTLKAFDKFGQDFFEDLAARLSASKFIDSQTTALQFAKLFTGTPVKRKVNWVGSRAKAPMLYFMYLLFERYKILEYPSQPFPRIVNSFTLDNEEIDRDTKAHDVLRSSYNKIRNGKYPGELTRKAIDKIVQKTLESHSHQQ
ncbi:MAG: hypothetical protein J0L87_01485 [Bacteroidetes bacterium]|nr:hypothetical protein [Bacteroidota bacterium]